jgi:serine/threonine protein kinase
MDLIENMLQIVPEQRISIPEILKHPWLKSDKDIIDGEESDDDHDF